MKDAHQLKYQRVGPHTSSGPRYQWAARNRPATLRAASAVAALALLALTACSGGGDGSPSDGSSPASPQSTSATGKPDELTVVDTANLSGLKEEASTKDLAGGVEAELSYPRIPKADPLTERLGEIVEQDAADFAGAVTDAKSYSVDWDVSAAGGNVIGVRLNQQEKDDDGERARYSTYWYNTESGHTAYSTELLDGQKKLSELNGLVAKQLKNEKGVDASGLHPIAELYDSIGFNPDGDVVVEFDEGQVASAGKGRVSAIVPAKEAKPLLSPLGKRAREAAMVVTPDFSIDKAASAPKDGTPEGSVPGMFATGGDEVDCTDPESKCIALTFDDGPGAETPKLLDALAEHDAKATFFVTGGPVREHPDTVRREYAEGHELANHTVHHPDLTSLNKGSITDELTTVNELVRRETGVTMDLMRPPYGATDEGVAVVTEKMGQAQIIWSIDTNDWRNHDPGVVSDRAVERARPGSIVLMHDIHSSTVDAVPDILERLDKKGYTMVTVSQLLGETKPGKKYIDGHPEKPDPSPSASPSN